MSDKKEFDRDSISNTLIVAIGLSLVCSIIVSSAAIVLKPVQQKNEELFRQQIILDVAGLMEPGADVNALFSCRDEIALILGFPGNSQPSGRASRQ